MKYLAALLLFISVTSYAQENKIEIHLRSDSIINTDWIELHELPFFQKPFVRIDNNRGPKIRIDKIKSY